MSIEFVLWVLLPMLLGAVFVVVSASCMWKAPSIGQCVALLLVMAGVAFAEIVLFSIARGTWPTFLPHILLTLVLVVVAGQVAAAARRRHLAGH